MTTEPPTLASSPAPAPAARDKRTKLVRPHRLAVNLVIGIATVLAVVSIFATWANRQIFNPDNWAKTSTKLLQDPAVQSATANFLVAQLYKNVDVESALHKDLPPVLQPLAGPASGVLRTAAEKTAKTALATPAVQNLWGLANKGADAAFVAAISGGNKTVSTKEGALTLNLRPILGAVASEVGLPASIADQLPPTAGQIHVAHSGKLELIQKICNALRSLALVLSILVPLLFILAILIAQTWRVHTLMVVGFAVSFAGLLVLLVRALLISQLTNSLAKEPSGRAALHSVVSIGTRMLGDIGGAYMFVGIIVIIAAWFAGPSRWATTGRRAIAPLLHDYPSRAFAATFVVMLIVFIWQPIEATGKLAGMIAFMALALIGTEALRRQTDREFSTGPLPTGNDPSAPAVAGPS